MTPRCYRCYGSYIYAAAYLAIGVAIAAFLIAKGSYVALWLPVVFFLVGGLHVAFSPLTLCLSDDTLTAKGLLLTNSIPSRGLKMGMGGFLYLKFTNTDGERLLCPLFLEGMAQLRTDLRDR